MYRLITMMLLPLCCYGGEKEFWPPDIVPTATSLGIYASPKEVVLHTTFSDGSVTKRQWSFYEDGTLQKGQANGNNFYISVRNDRHGKIKEVTHTAIENENDNYTKYVPLKRNSLGLVELIGMESATTSGLEKTVSTSAMRIRYAEGAHAVEPFIRSEKIAGYAARWVFEYDKSGRLAATCSVPIASKIAPIIGPCDRSTLHIEYGPNGPLLDVGHNLRKTYKYHAGNLVSMEALEIATEKPSELIRYSGYENDICGNWTSRSVEVEAHDVIATFREKRKISYFTKCINE